MQTTQSNGIKTQEYFVWIYFFMKKSLIVFCTMHCLLILCTWSTRPWKVLYESHPAVSRFARKLSKLYSAVEKLTTNAPLSAASVSLIHVASSSSDSVLQWLTVVMGLICCWAEVTEASVYFTTGYRNNRQTRTVGTAPRREAAWPSLCTLWPP